MTLYTQVDKNKRKTFFYVFLFLILIIFFGWIFSWIYNSLIILYLAIIISVLQALSSYYVGDKIALAISHATPAKREEYVELHRLVENLAITAGLPKPKVYIIPEDAPNAFATGRDPKHASVAVTRGLLETLEKKELEGVISHELAHIGNRDSLLMVVVVFLVGVIAILSNFFLRMRFWGFGDNRERSSSGFMLIVTLLIAILAPIAAILIQLAISRKREFMADASGALLTRYPQGLADALKKLSSDKRQMKYANDATSLLYISNPMKRKSWMSNLFSTHPSTEDRIRLLERM
jgi:heat shock protein HtpX